MSRVRRAAMRPLGLLIATFLPATAAQAQTGRAMPDSLMHLGMRPIFTLTPGQARQQPTFAYGVMAAKEMLRRGEQV